MHNTTQLWTPLQELIHLDAADLRVRGYARLEPDRAWEHFGVAREARKRLEGWFGTRPPYGVDISLNISLGRIGTSSLDPRQVVQGILELQ
jgi:hypothetical protein